MPIASPRASASPTRAGTLPPPALPGPIRVGGAPLRAGAGGAGRGRGAEPTNNVSTCVECVELGFLGYLFGRLAAFIDLTRVTAQFVQQVAQVGKDPYLVTAHGAVHAANPDLHVTDVGLADRQA